MSALTPAEKQLITYHLGYPVTESVERIGMGVPGPMQVEFLVQSQLGRVPTGLLPKVRQLLCNLEETEAAIHAGLPEAGASRVGETTLRGAERGETALDLRKSHYTFLAQCLSDLLGVPLYPFSKRFQNAATGNVRVSR